MASAACPWEINIDQNIIQPVEAKDLPPKERRKFAKDQHKKEKTITRQEVVEDLTQHAPDEEDWDGRDAPSAFSAIFGKSHVGKSDGSSTKSSKSDDGDSKKSSKSVFSRMKNAKRREDSHKQGGDWKKIP